MKSFKSSLPKTIDEIMELILLSLISMAQPMISLNIWTGLLSDAKLFLLT